ncbi:MAG: transcriptional regulator TrmB [Parcubacteria group bacterium Gr01-1014_29]|nr:MAG: transcriptional regulator TrmB [Parcubacteria group bacterium Gr01-1014_29]
MEIKDELKKVGLTGQEIAVYLYLLEQGVSSPPQIAKGTGILRPNTYGTIRDLEDKGLVEHQEKGRRLLYMARDPSAILANLETRRDVISRILPDLRSLYKATKNKPTIRFYYGLEEIKSIFGRIEGAKDLLFVISTDKLFEAYPTFFERFRRSIVSQQIFVRDVLTQRSSVTVARKTKEVMKGYYDFRLFPKKYEDLPTTIRMWNDNVAFVILDDPELGIVITSKALGATFRVMFEAMWEAGEKV